MNRLRVCRHGEIPEGELRLVRDGKLEIGVFFRDGQYHAYRNLCPHQGGPVCEGRRMFGVVDLIDGDGQYLGQDYDKTDMHIVCPWHGYEFHLETGVNVSDPQIKLRRFAVEREGDEIYVVV